MTGAQPADRRRFETPNATRLLKPVLSTPGALAFHSRAGRDDPVRDDLTVSPPLVVRVVPLVTTRALREPLDYLAPEGAELVRGDVVHVPLAGRNVRGVVVDTGGPARHEGELSSVERIAEEPRMAPVVLDLCLWIAGYYGSTPARALALALPPRVRAPSDTWVSATGSPGTTARRRALLELLADGPLPLAELLERAGTTPATVRRLARDGLVALEARLRVPRVSAGRTPRPDALTEAQTAAVARIETLIEAGGGDLLLHGVTGSGKTEVYLRAAESALSRGRTVLALVPEIALSPQTARRFAARFGDQVAVLHSGLSDGERRAVREAVGAGDVRVVVGARSAVFLPLPRVGLIVVDEEHEPAYKQGDDPRYTPAASPPSERASRVPCWCSDRPRRARRAGNACRAQHCRRAWAATFRGSRSSIFAATGSIRSRGPCARG